MAACWRYAIGCARARAGEVAQVRQGDRRPRRDRCIGSEREVGLVQRARVIAACRGILREDGLRNSGERVARLGGKLRDRGHRCHGRLRGQFDRVVAAVALVATTEGHAQCERALVERHDRAQQQVRAVGRAAQLERRLAPERARGRVRAAHGETGGANRFTGGDRHGNARLERRTLDRAHLDVAEPQGEGGRREPRQRRGGRRPACAARRRVHVGSGRGPAQSRAARAHFSHASSISFLALVRAAAISSSLMYSRSPFLYCRMRPPWS